jgi:hypothetical protein
MYERARRLAPRDPDILANLKFAEQRLGVDEVNTPPRALQRYSEFRHCEPHGQRSGVHTNWYALAHDRSAVGAFHLHSPESEPASLVIAMVALLGFSVSTFALGYEVINDRTAPRAVVVVRETEARFAPVIDSTVHFKLAEGTTVAVREDRGQWLFVERVDGQQGWVKSEAVERVGAF